MGGGNSTLCAGELLKGGDAGKDAAKKPRLLGRTWSAVCATLRSAGGAHGQAVEALHLVAHEKRGIFQKSVQESDRVGAPENFAVEREARHAEDPARSGLVGVFLQGGLDLLGGKAGPIDAKLPA